MNKALLLFVLGLGQLSDADPYITSCPKNTFEWPLNHLETFLFEEPKGVFLPKDDLKE